jgi:hypothetical protein
VTSRLLLGPHPCNLFALTPKLPFGPQPCNPFALVASPKLGLRQMCLVGQCQNYGVEILMLCPTETSTEKLI